MPPPYRPEKYDGRQVRPNLEKAELEIEKLDST
jgi:hypothetical protein